MAAHVENVGCDYSIEPDRGEAIRMAVMEAETPTVILITGKGAETRQKRGTAYIDCISDVDYTKEALHDYDVLHHLDGMEKVLGLLETLPRLAESAGKTVVLKYGGSALGEGGAVDSILRDVAALQMAGVRVPPGSTGTWGPSSILSAYNTHTPMADIRSPGHSWRTTGSPGHGWIVFPPGSVHGPPHHLPRRRFPSRERKQVMQRIPLQ